MAVHTNYAFVPGPMNDELPPEDMEACAAQEAMDFDEGAYHHIQETRSDSLTVAQADSPAGFAAWVIEKFRSWSDCDGDVESVFSKDLLCTNLMFYWAPASIASAARIYWETAHDPFRHWGWPNPQILAPTAIASFPKDPGEAESPRPGWKRRRTPFPAPAGTGSPALRRGHRRRL